MEPVKLLWPALRHTNTSLCRVLISRVFSNLSKQYSTQNAQQTQEVTTTEKIDLSKPSVVKWKRPPFLKNFFIGKFDIELMAFPEILNNEQLSELESHVKDINNLMRQKVNTIEVENAREIPNDLLRDLKALGLFGRMIPAKYGGLDLTYTACTRLNEVLGLDWSIASTLAAHEFFATQVILQFGTDAQKSTYLPKMASGDLIGALCSSEFESGSDLSSMTTSATQTPEGNFVINGSKCWVTNAQVAGLFVVFAKTVNTVDPKASDISVFLVEKDTKGVQIAPHDKICLNGLKTGIVHFDDVVIPPTSLIGNLGHGYGIYLKISESFKIAMSTFTFGTLKALLDSVTNRVIHKERVEKSLADYQLVRTRLSRINSMIYGMESLSYFTAALLDSTENPDITFESTALKVFNSDGTLYCLRELIEVVGSSSLMTGSQLDRFYRDAQGLAMFDAPNDISRLFLGLKGCQSAGERKAEDIMKMRNTYFFPYDILKQHIRHWRIQHNVFKYEHDIAGHIHPSLVVWGNKIERNLQGFEVAVEAVLTEHGNKVVDIQIDPIKLANIVIDLYAWSAVLSRCSRSYVIGLKNCHHELRLAEAFCHDADTRVSWNIHELFLGLAKNNEKSHLLLGEQVIDCQGYFPEHPLKHNY